MHWPGMLLEFMKWWGAQLLTLIPSWIADSNAGAANALIVDLPAGFRPDGEGVRLAGMQLRLRRNHREISLGPLSLDRSDKVALRGAGLQRLPKRLLLRVPESLLLEREVMLPAVAEADWRSVLRHEMPRLTPFPADAVFWTGAITRHDRQSGRIAVRLSIIPKSTLDPVIAALRQAKLDPAAIEIAIPAGSRIIDLATAPGTARRAGNLKLLGGICAGLALVAIILPFLIQLRRAAVVNHRIATLQPVARRVEALRRRILTGSSSINVIARERAQVGDPLAVLAAVTAALPDNTYLTELHLRHLKLDIAGKSAAAAPLLSALSADPSLRDVAFSAPVNRDSTDHKDLFSIKATIMPGVTR